MERKIYNPIQKDTVTFLKLGSETNGAYTLVEVELADGGGVGLHYHQGFTEKFEALEGAVQVKIGETMHTLTTGQTATAELNIPHLFQNRSGQPCRFLVELRPASRGFEQSLQIGYGLAADGETNKRGFPKNKLVLAWLFHISASNLTGFLHFFEPVLRWQARKAVAKGLDRVMIEKYVRF
jgi:quercetin dioxygenase-like cupin family protein